MRSHSGMKDRSAQADALRAIEIGFDRNAIRKESNPAQRIAVCRLDRDTHFSESCDSVRHQAFTASLVDRRLGTGPNGDREALATQLKRGGSMVWTASNKKYSFALTHMALKSARLRNRALHIHDHPGRRRKVTDHIDAGA